MFTHRLSRWLTDILMYGVLIAISIFMILPFLWMVSTSLKPAEEIFVIPPIIISPHSSLNAYAYLQEQYKIFGIVKNTFVIAFSATMLRLFFCALGGYGFAKFKFPGQGVLFAFLLGTMVVPGAVTLVPVYIIMRNLKWIDTFWPLIIPGAANAFGIFFMRQYMLSIPDELLDAARVDGASELRIFARIVLPLTTPALIALGIIFFIAS